jgi:hypothetical protein
VGQLRRARDLPLAALPLLLGTHQIIESVIWSSGGGTGVATMAWAVIALPVLAVWVPAGVLLAAPPTARRRLRAPAAAGLATAVALAYCLATQPVTAEIRGHTLGYLLDLPHPALIIAGYVLATVGSLLLGTDPVLRLLGVLVGAGAVVCAVLWRLEFVSTWCAVAAVASVVMLGWVRHGHARYRSPASDRCPVAQRASRGESGRDSVVGRGGIMVNSAQEYTAPVVVTLSDCSKEDADTVFHVLAQSYASDRADDDTPEYVPGAGTTVWTSTFEVSSSHAPAEPVPLTAPVEAGIQGGYWGVDRLREALGCAFTVREEGMAAGDQEKDIQLRLDSGSGGSGGSR